VNGEPTNYLTRVLKKDLISRSPAPKKEDCRMTSNGMNYIPKNGYRPLNSQKMHAWT
jgi:hypothetical protein